MNRERLPDERAGITHKFTIADRGDRGEIEVVKGYLTVGHYPDGRVGEIFVKMDKQGSQVSGFADAFAICFSMLLQAGVPLEELCRKFRGASFPPAGRTSNPNIRQCRSPVDYVARYLEGKYVDPEMTDDAPVNGGARPESCDVCKSASVSDFVLDSNGEWYCQRCVIAAAKEGR